MSNEAYKACGTVMGAALLYLTLIYIGYRCDWDAGCGVWALAWLSLGRNIWRDK